MLLLNSLSTEEKINREQSYSKCDILSITHFTINAATCLLNFSEVRDIKAAEAKLLKHLSLRN